MIKKYNYYYVPKHQSVYRVQFGCCYRRVIFAGELIDIAERMDEPFGEFNSEHLECGICIPGLEIIEISRDTYEEKERMVLDYKDQFTKVYLSKQMLKIGYSGAG